MRGYRCGRVALERDVIGTDKPKGSLFRLAWNLRQRAGWWWAGARRKVLGRHVELVAEDGHWICGEVDWC